MSLYSKEQLNNYKMQCPTRHKVLMKVSNKITDLWNKIPSSLVYRCPTTWYYIPDDHNLDTMP